MLAPTPKSPGSQLRELMASGPVLLPGVFNAISALAAQKVGAKALYISGAGITNAALGVPDIALATLTEFAQQARYVTSVTSLPVLSDADTGFGSALSVARTVIEMEGAGLAGIHIEDQVSPKRCGHLDGKACIDPAEMQSKIRAACTTRRDPSFMIVARTDARGPEGLLSAIDRAKAYIDAGADAVFPEGLESREEFEQVRKELPVPLLANMTEFGKTPLISFREFSDLGYELVIFPMTAFRVMLAGLLASYDTLFRDGSQASLIDSMKSRRELYELLEYSKYEAKDVDWSHGPA